MSKQYNSIQAPIFLHLQTLPKDKLQQGSHIFDSIKHALKLTVTQYQKSDEFISNKALIGAAEGLIEIIRSIRTEDTAPDHKQRVGFKLYSNKLANFHKKDIFKNNNIKAFEQVQDSCYMQTELARRTKGYKGGYSHTYKLTSFGLSLYKSLQEVLMKFNKTPKIKDILGLKTIKSSDLEGIETIKVPYKRFKEIYNFYHKIFVTCEYDSNKEFKDSMRSIPFLLKHVIGYKGGYVYISNTSLGKIKQDRDYTVYTCLSKALRKYLHPDYMEIDLDSACLSMNLNIYNEIKRQSEETHIILKRKNSTKLILRQFNESDTKIEFPIINAYMNNKYEGRIKIQSALGLKDVKEAKQFVTSLNFDSNRGNLEFNTNSRKANTIYTKQLISEIGKLQRVINETVFKSDRKFSIMGVPATSIRKDVEESISEHRSIKANEGKYGRGKKFLGKRMARLYFRLEKKVRDTIISYLDSKGVKDYHQIHDCLVFSKKYKNEVQKQDIKELIYAKYGYTLTLSSSEDIDILKKD